MGKKNPIVHLEWRTNDTERLKNFYGALFNWKFEEVAPGLYTRVDMHNKELHGGIVQIQAAQLTPVGMSNFVAVDNLEETEEQIRALGGRIIASKQEVPGGAYSLFADLDNNTLAVWQSAPKAQKKDKKKKDKKKKDKDKGKDKKKKNSE